MSRKFFILITISWIIGILMMFFGANNKEDLEYLIIFFFFMLPFLSLICESPRPNKTKLWIQISMSVLWFILGFISISFPQIQAKILIFIGVVIFSSLGMLDIKK